MISIPDPCNEDFSKMSQTERGAFCNKCSIDTFDFRSLSNNEINHIIKDNAGQHICGRFNKSQLDDLNAGFLNWKNQNPRIFQSKFILACIMVFGLTLFSCLDEQTIQEMNQIEMSQDDSKAKFINYDLGVNELDLLDYIQVQLPEPVLDPIGCKILDYELGGEIAADYDVEQIFETRGEVMIAGGIRFNDHYIEYVEEILPVDSSKILVTQSSTDPRIFEASTFPNPTQGLTTLALNIEQEGQFDIVLYNMNGQMVKNIHSGILSEGRNQFEFDLTDKNSGMYIVKVISQGQNETLKISKVN